MITGNLSPAKSEKVSCGLIFTQPNPNVDGGFDTKFSCMDTFPDGSYTSQNAVQGTSSVKFPVKNYKVYLTSGYELDEEKDKETRIFLEDLKDSYERFKKVPKDFYEEFCKLRNNSLN